MYSLPLKSKQPYRPSARPHAHRSHLTDVNPAEHSTGHPLDSATRSGMETHFGHDFSQVRIHEGRSAAQKSGQFHARAVTIGQDIYFNRDNYPPAESRNLLAHELAHVVQHNLSTSASAGNIPRAEAEADQAARAVNGGLPVAVATPVPAQTPLKDDANPTTEDSRFQLPPPSLQFPSQSTTTTTHEFVLEGFATDSAGLQPRHLAVIQQIADELNRNPLILGSFVTIWGFTDEPGTAQYNQQLGEQRANAVRDELSRLVTDPDTRREIRAYSGGERFAERPGPAAEFRRVTITITRRNFRFPSMGTLSTPVPSLTFPLPSRQTPNPLSLRPGLGLTPPGQTLPPWFWQSISPPNRPQLNLNEFSRALTDGLRQPLAAGTARLAERLAGVVGIRANRAEIRQFLDQALIDGGEAGLKELLRQMIYSIAGPPTTPSALPYGPALRESLPSPTIIRTPEIRF